MPKWAFLTSHAMVLIYISQHPASSGLEIAQAVGITERAVRKILSDLQAAGYVTTEKLGRRNRYQVDVAVPLMRLGERAVTVGQLLDLLRGAAPTDSASRARRPAERQPA